MPNQPLSHSIKHRIRAAAHTIGTADPIPYVGKLLDRSFERPIGDERYAHNTLTPGTVAFEPSYSERESNALRFTIEPLGPDAMPALRRQEATREMRRLTSMFGSDVLRWFDAASENWRAQFGHPNLRYGAWFGTSYDQNGLRASKIYYELSDSDLSALPRGLRQLAAVTLKTLPMLAPVFTTLSCQRGGEKQRVTFIHRGPFRLADLGPLLDKLDMSSRLANLLRVTGVALGGRFNLPDQSMLLGISGNMHYPEIKIEILLGMLDDLPPDFLHLLSLNMTEKPRQLQALQCWLNAYTPAPYNWPGEFSVLSIILTKDQPASVNLYLRPLEFDMFGSSMHSGAERDRVSEAV